MYNIGEENEQIEFKIPLMTLMIRICSFILREQRKRIGLLLSLKILRL